MESNKRVSSPRMRGLNPSATGVKGEASAMRSRWALLFVVMHIAGFAAAFSNRGNAYARKGQYDRAIQDYDQAIRINPSSFGDK
jgi:tetratricopeptide (TPR) repeat protein